jgi:pyruvate,water dikinase
VVTYVVSLDACRRDDVPRVGGKCAGLGELLAAGLPVPPGFAIATDAFAQVLAAEGLDGPIERELGAAAPGDVAAIDAASARVRALIEAAPLPGAIEAAIRDAYAALSGGADVPVAVRSSATMEDLAGASFAGQQDTYLWVVGADAVLDAVRRCWASLYTARAIAYRRDTGLAGPPLMAVAVQQMVRARAAGVALTLNPINGDRSKIVIDSSFGLGETVVGGRVTPDSFVVDKVILEVVRRTISDKHVELVVDGDAGGPVERPVEPDRRLEPSLTLDEVKAVARLAKAAERHWGCPQDVEWALDADTGDPVLLQSRPETAWSTKAQAPGPARRETGLDSVLTTLMSPVATKKTSR